ncbi:uridine kinase [Streptomyces sp. HNM0574]|uniref:uridine kinase n=1 Tax=Streptomyces sp. HNM0574 TaxID=2714954 RepID=UPI00146DB915|nr:uridine kinase [Streptomyces sp. HNM0574]NLU67529.1 uridine kinase [Streptomyces sp. HNM0574]
MSWEPVTWERLVPALAERIAGTGTADGGTRVRVALDGAPAAGPDVLAGRLAEELRLRGRPSVTVGTRGFLRPASLRYEFGKQDADAYYDGWQDTSALWREVFNPLDPGGSGTVLPDLWDPVTDRATRSPRVPLEPGGVLLLHGPFLLGHWFPFDLTVHLRLTPAALARRTAPTDHWTLPAYTRYTTETTPESTADITIRTDNPHHPAWNFGQGEGSWRPQP